MSKRFFRHRELHVVLLAMLAERPMHGYELMRELADRFGPSYRPSAGSVYPALESLAAEGLIEPQAASDPTTFVLTPIGETALSNRGTDLVKLEQRTGVTLGAAVPIEAALARLTDAARRAARLASLDDVERVLDEVVEQLEALINKENS